MISPLSIGTSLIHPADIAIEPNERQKHMAVFGKSGVGKSTLLGNAIIQDIRSGAGVTVIDPHGGLIEELLPLIPRRRQNDVIYLNPLARDRVVGINLLERVADGQQPLVIESLVSTLRNIWPDSWGKRTYRAATVRVDLEW